MPCPSDSYGGDRDNNRHWQNWLGNVSYVVPSYFQPSSRQDLVWILQEAEAQGKKIKAVGCGWSFEDCAASEDWVVDIRQLNNTITFLTHPATGPTFLTVAWAARQFRASAEKLYHVEAGIRIFDLNQRLEREGLAMLTLGGSQGQTLAGAISTSTHGSDLDQPPLPGVIQAIHLVTTGGQEVWIESDSEPITANDEALRRQLVCGDLQIIRDDELLRAAMVTVGRFGAVYSYVIKVTAFYRLSEWTEELSWPSVSDALVAGIGQGNNVPVRGHLGSLPGLLSDPPAGLEISTEAGHFRFLDILINPNLKARHGGEVCWVRRRWLTHNANPLNLSARENPLCHHGVANVLLTAAGAALGAYASHVVAIPIYGIVKAAQITAHVISLNALAHDPHITGGEALAAALNAVWDSQIGDELEWLVADLNHIILEKPLDKSRDEGIRGPGWQVLAGLTEGTTGECYRANSTELIFSTETRVYINFVNRLLDNADDFHMGGFISIRFSSRSNAYLSMHNVSTPLAVSIEVTSLYGLEDSQGWVAFAERIGKEMGGRPHWGQQNQMSTLDLLSLYNLEDLQAWWHQCFRMVGAVSKTFSNNYTRQRGLEPMRHPDTAFMMISPPVLGIGKVLRNTPITRDRGLTVSSVGTGLLVTQGVHLQGPQAAAFSIEPHLPGAFPFTLQPGDAFPISIRFQSASVGEHQASVVVTGLDDRSGSQEIVEAILRVNVVGPDMSVLPTVINFGRVQVGQPVVRNVLVTNDGSAPLRFRVPPLASQPPRIRLTSFESRLSFQWPADAPNSWRTLPPGESETVPVRYLPMSVGEHSAQVVIVADGETANVPLFGEGVLTS